MDLSENYSNLKYKYRKLFYDSVKEIDDYFSKGLTLDKIECLYKENFRRSYANVIAEYKSFNCAGCGVCCRFAVSEFSPAELDAKAQNGDNYAFQFVKTFIPYETIDDARLVFPEYVEFLDKNVSGKYYIYHCPKVTDDNRCPDYENRPQICRDFPEINSIFLPKVCAFNPWKLKSESVWLKLNAVMEILDFYKNNKKDL